MCVLNALKSLLHARVPRETTTLQLDIFNKRKQHIDENNVKKVQSEEDKVHILQTISYLAHFPVAR